ncbi:MAG: type II toxin-antitoxin system RelE/ParE family toxin [Mariprofundaceae bacterium]|nr:type II toxin-antitoxin system RelE/ParE family toxin [Mariprofundaceae bacterium]
MECEVEYTHEFGGWWQSLNEGEQEDIAASVRLLEQYGPSLPFPHSSGVKGSKHGHMRELRVQHKGRPYRILYAFDPRRIAILLIGGDKTGKDDWYERFVPVADSLYDAHLQEIKGADDSEKGGR